MRRFLTLITLVAAAWGAPAVAAAETPIHGNFEFRLGGYYPAIDDEFGDNGPFAEVFGEKNLLLGELEVDGYLWQRFGKFGIHGNIGFSKVKGTAIAADTAEQDAVEDTTTFGITPLRAGLVYRYDYSAIHHGIPLAAVFKGGLDFYRWRIADSNGETASVGGETGAGWTNGWHLSAALHLLLDIIDPASAAAFDLSWGVNNSYLFVEYMMTKIDDFGGGGFDLSDNIWMFGLSFEY